MELARLIQERIERDGPLRFSEFMRAALYEPGLGYYTRTRDPFGRAGDFYTAAQLQPVFGELVAAAIHRLCDAANLPRVVVDLGPGRREMAESLRDFRYIPVDVGDMLPERFSGVVFANEFFDALPVDVAVWRDGQYRQRRVGVQGERFVWVDAEPLPHIPEQGEQVELSTSIIRWISALASHLERGYVIIIDYGYTNAERRRFPQGTLMSYRSHAASANVLCDPGERDITAHVDFTALEQAAHAAGFTTGRFMTLQQWLLSIGEPDQFASVLRGDTETRRGQLKSLLFGMGETFRVLILRK